MLTMEETKPLRIYIPTQRCPHCKSADTTMQLIPGKKTHIDREPVGTNQWTCNRCKTQFKPSETQIAEPILICTNCKDMTPHKFVRNEEVHHTPPSDAQPRVPAFNVNHHVISHMYSCKECGTVRVYGCHIGEASPRQS
jgi:hypothetical protein